MNTDPIADLINRIKNAHNAKHESVEVPHSKQKYEIAKILTEKKWIKEAHVKKDGNFKALRIELNTEIPSLHIKRISKPGRKVYVEKNAIPKIRNGLGNTIISTSKGIMTGEEAHKANLGGELICEIY